MLQASSLSGRSPLIPIEPTTFPFFSIKTPPATGAMRPAEIVLRAAQNVGVSIARFAIARPPIPIPIGPQALAKAISGLSTPLPSSRFITMAAPPASTTATVIGLHFSSRAFANAPCTMASASCNVNPHISLLPSSRSELLETRRRILVLRPRGRMHHRAYDHARLVRAIAPRVVHPKHYGCITGPQQGFVRVAHEVDLAVHDREHI